MNTIFSLGRNIFGRGVPAFLTLALTPFYLKNLGLDGYSLIVLIIFLNNLIDLFDFGLKSGIQQTALASSEDDNSNLIGYAIAYFGVMTMVLLFVLIFKNSILSLNSFEVLRLNEYYFFLFALVVVSRLPLGALHAILSATYRVRLLNTLLVLESGLKHAFLVLVILYGKIGNDSVILSSLFSLIGVILYLVFKHRHLFKTNFQISFTGFKNNIRFSRDMYISYLSGFLTSQGDRVLVLGLLTPTELSFYGLLTTAGSILHVPGAAMLMTTEQELFRRKQLYSEQIKWLLWFLRRTAIVLIVILLSAVFCHEIFFNFWLGNDTSDWDFSPFLLLILGYLFYYISAPITTLFNVKMKPELLRNYNLIAGPISLCLSYFLVDHYGVFGASLALMINFLMLFQILTYTMFRRIKLMGWFWLNLALPFYSIAFSVLMYVFYDKV